MLSITQALTSILPVKSTRLFPVMMAGCCCFASQAQVLTQHNTISRTGWYDQETILHTKNVRPGSFGIVFTRTVDDQIYAQPLVARNINLPGLGMRNVVYVAAVN